MAFWILSEIINKNSRQKIARLKPNRPLGSLELKPYLQHDLSRGAEFLRFWTNIQMTTFWYGLLIIEKKPTKTSKNFNKLKKNL